MFGLSREEDKALYHNYRKRARELFQDVGQVDSSNIHIPDAATVQMTEKGAFVDAIVWIPLTEVISK